MKVLVLGIEMLFEGFELFKICSGIESWVIVLACVSNKWGSEKGGFFIRWYDRNRIAVRDRMRRAGRQTNSKSLINSSLFSVVASEVFGSNVECVSSGIIKVCTFCMQGKGGEGKVPRVGWAMYVKHSPTRLHFMDIK